MIQANDIVYESGNEKSYMMTAESVNGDKVLCSWKIKGERYEKEYEIGQLTKSHPKFGSPIPE